MGTDLPLRCACGALRGTARDVSASRGNRLVCYCDDCQSFAYFLGGAERILDAHGGTDIFQLSPARLELTEGTAHLACLRLTPRGMLRWYADCCRTPVGNTLPSHRIPFVGLIHCFTDHAGDGRPRDVALGPVRYRLMARFATGDRSGLQAHDRTPPALLLRLGRQILAARLRRDHLHSPFFDASTGAPVAEPTILSPEQLRRLEAARDAGGAQST